MVFSILKNFVANSYSTSLESAESNILSYVKTPYKGFHVPVHGISTKSRIWTVVFNEKSEGVPIVLVHGFLLGLGCWAANIDCLVKNGPVYAFDILGFGRSSRPPQLSSSDWIDSLEEWRTVLNLDKMILVGYSMGGYIVTRYAIKFPDSVAHLVLVDPWGFAPKPEHVSRIMNTTDPIVIKTASFLSNYFNVWWMHFRCAGTSLGLKMLRKSSFHCFTDKYEILGEGGGDAFAKYMIHCNAGTPVGENAFREIMSCITYAKEPLSEQLHLIREDVGVTYIYGEQSTMPHLELDEIFDARRNDDSIKVYELPDCGHDLFLDRRIQFNKLINEVATKVGKQIG